MALLGGAVCQLIALSLPPQLVHQQRVRSSGKWLVRLWHETSVPRMEGVFPKLEVHRLYHHPTGNSRI